MTVVLVVLASTGADWAGGLMAGLAIGTLITASVLWRRDFKVNH